MLVDGLQHSHAGWNLLGGTLDRRMYDHRSAMFVRRIAHAARNVHREAAVRWLPRRETRACGKSRLDPVDAEGSPIVAIQVPGGQIPPAPGVHQTVRLHFSLAPRTVTAVI